MPLFDATIKKKVISAAADPAFVSLFLEKVKTQLKKLKILN